jgi:hypothetical protein
MKKEVKLCKDCVNFIEDEIPNKISCDWRFFENVDKSKGYINVPEMFHCDKWEDQNKFK